MRLVSEPCDIGLQSTVLTKYEKATNRYEPTNLCAHLGDTFQTWVQQPNKIS